MKKLLLLLLVSFVSIANSQNQAICGGSSATITPAASATTPTLNPGNQSPAAGIYVVSPTVTTNYTIITTVATATPSIFTTNSVVNTVTVNPMPVVSPTFTQSTCTNSNNCFNLNLTFNPPNPAPTYTVLWSNFGQGPPVIPSCAPAITDYSCCGYIFPGVYETSITAAGGCGMRYMFTITPIPQPATFTTTPAGNTVSVTCLNPTLVVSASNPNNTYTWTVPSLGIVNDQSVSVTSSNQGTIGIVATNTLSQCTASLAINLTINTVVPISAVSPTSQVITCTNAIQVVTLTATTPTINFTHQVIPLSNPTSTYVSNTQTAGYLPGPDTYSYVLIDNVNGCSTSKQFTVTSNGGFPTFSLTSNQNFSIGCNSKSLTTVSIPIPVITSPTLGAPVSFAFVNPANPVPPVFGPNSTQTVITPGTWTVYVKDDNNFCVTPKLMSILQTTNGPTVDTILVSHPVLTCDNPSVAIQAFSDDSGISYNWTYTVSGLPQNVATSTVASNAIFATPNSTLVNTYVLRLTDNNSACVTTKSVTILQNIAPPTPSITSITTSLTCKTTSITLTNNSRKNNNAAFASPLPAIGFKWIGPTPLDPLDNSTTYLATIKGTYTMTAKDLNNGCTATTATFQIGDNVVYPDVISPGTTTIECGQKSDTLRPSIASATTGLSYTWTAPPGVPTATVSLRNLPVSLPGTYTVLVTNTLNSCASTATLDAVTGSLTAEIEPSTLFGYAPLDVTFTNLSRAGVINTSVTTIWNFGNDSVLTTPQPTVSPVIRYSQPGIYVITAYSGRGACLAKTSKTVTVEYPSSLVVPNVFTPNGDNVNDLFFLKANSLSEISIWIYDRWGKLVYELVSKTGNIAWDGTSIIGGKECAEGTYFYVLRAKGRDGVDYDTKGNISLYR